MNNSPDATAILETFKAEEKKAEPALVVMPELKGFLDILTEDERKGLEADLVASGGPRDPIVVWKEKNAIVDGHNRYSICLARGLPFKKEYMSFKDIDAVKQWMLRNQLNRRNLTPMRVTYFRGLLYNQTKQDPTKARADQGGKSTAAKLGEQFGVNEKTIRRDGAVAAGIEAVGRVHGLTSVRDKIEKIKEKNLAFNKEELEEIGKVEDPKVQEEAVKILEQEKKEDAKTQAVVKQQVAKVKEAIKPVVQKAKEVEKKAPYGVVFVKPAFDSLSYNAAAEVKPPMAENAVCYMLAPDEELGKAMALLNRWGLKYEGALIIPIDDGYESAFSNVTHVFGIVATKGVNVFKGKAVNSLVPKGSNPEDAMIKIIDGYHPSEKRLDMRKGRTAKGWDAL